MTLTLDRVILHTVVHYSSTSTYTPNFIEIEETLCGRTDVCTYVCKYVHSYLHTDGHLRPALLGRLCQTVNLKILDNWTYHVVQNAMYSILDTYTAYYITFTAATHYHIQLSSKLFWGNCTCSNIVWLTWLDSGLLTFGEWVWVWQCHQLKFRMPNYPDCFAMTRRCFKIFLVSVQSHTSLLHGV